MQNLIHYWTNRVILSNKFEIYIISIKLSKYLVNKTDFGIYKIILFIKFCY